MDEKKAFLLFNDYIEQFEMLTDQQAGELIKLILRHVNGIECEIKDCDITVQVLFSVIKGTVDRGIERMADKKQHYSDAAKRREEKKAGSGKTCQNSASSAQTETETKTKTKTKAETKARAEAESTGLAESSSAHADTGALPESGSLSENEDCNIPDIGEVSAYCRERGNSVDPKVFVDYYGANGWRIRGDAVRDWKALIRLWESREKNTKPAAEPSYSIGDISERTRAKYAALNENYPMSACDTG